LSIPHRKYLLVLSLVFALLWALLAISPWDRETWLVENALAVAAAALIIGYHRKLLLSRVSYTLIFIFMCLHQVGAHYSYAEVPYDAWFESLTGRTFNELVGWERNNFDRVIHFLYGLLLAYPIREVFLRVADVRGFWGYFLPLDLIEWWAAEFFGGDLGQAYLGTQGDVWDAHKDMALASLGALVAMLVTYAINRRFQRDFNREWADSLRVKHKKPLGEDALARLVRDGKH
jgi:putative membrane protein